MPQQQNNNTDNIDTSSIHAPPSLRHVQTITPLRRTIGQGSDALTFTDSSPAWQVQFSRNGQWMAVAFGAPSPSVRVYSKNDEKEWELRAILSDIQTRTIRSVAFAPITSPLVLASASFDGTIAIWECELNSNKSSNKTTTNNISTDDFDCVAQLEGHESEVKCVVWNETASLLASCGRDKSVWIWESFLPGTVGGTSNGGDFECVAVLNNHEADVKTIIFAPNNSCYGDGDEVLISGSYDDSICIFAEQMGDWYCAATIKGIHTSTIWSLAISPSASRLVSASADGSLAIYKLYTSSNSKSSSNGSTRSQNTSKSQNTPKNDTTDTQSGCECVGVLPLAHSGAIYSVDYASARAGHGRIVSCGSDGQIQVYREMPQSTSDNPIFSLEAAASAHSQVNSVSWHPIDGSMLVSASEDGNITIWEYK